MSADAFRVWVGCLACYSAGELRGQWFDATAAGDVVPEMLHTRPTSHEELWVMDTDNAPEGYAREMSPAEAQVVADRLEQLEEDERDPFTAWCANVGESLETVDVDDFRESFMGVWQSFDDYAGQLADDVDLFHGVPDDHPARTYFDWSGWTRDLIIGGDYWTHDTAAGVYVFRSY